MESFKESFKEIARLAIFAGVGAIVASLSQSVTNLDQNLVTAVILIVLRFTDKLVHESSLKAKGIVPF